MAKFSLRCSMGDHLVPQHIAFHTMGAVFQGGLCERCGAMLQRRFLKNAWTEEIEHETHTELRGFDVSDLEDQGYVVIGLATMQAAWEAGKIKEEGYPPSPLSTE